MTSNLNFLDTQWSTRRLSESFRKRLCLKYIYMGIYIYMFKIYKAGWSHPHKKENIEHESQQYGNKRRPSIIYIYIYIYIYIERERVRERVRCMYTNHIYIYIYMHICRVGVGVVVCGVEGEGGEESGRRDVAGEGVYVCLCVGMCACQ